MIYVFKYFELSCDVIFWTGRNGCGGVKWVCGHKLNAKCVKINYFVTCV